MKKRIFIGKNNNGYYFVIYRKVDNKWTVLESRNVSNKELNDLLNFDINSVRYIDNLLFVKTNDDLVVINNYLQLNHDKVFRNFNKKILNENFNKSSVYHKMSLQKKNNYKKAVFNSRFILISILVGSLVINVVPITLKSKSISNEIESEPRQEQQSKYKVMGKSVEPIKSSIDLEQEKIENEKRYFENKVREYFTMYFIDYEQGLKLVEKNLEDIKNYPVNQEIGLIKVMLTEFYDNSNIDKTPEVANMSSMERERLLLEFARIYEIKDIDTLATMLAIYRLETGNGTSDPCIYKNNFGGLRGWNEAKKEYYVLSFKTPKIGAEALVRNFLGIKEKALSSDKYDPLQSLEVNLNPIYCGESSWPGKITDLKQEVMEDYNLNSYVSKDKIKQFIKK